MTNGIFASVSFKNYKLTNRMNKSGLDKINKSPAHYQYDLLYPEAQTPAMEFGSAFHDLLLMPEFFSTDYTVSPKFDKRTTVGKDGYNEFVKLAGRKTVVSKDNYEIMLGMRDSVNNNKAAKALLTAGMPEATCYFNDGEIECKARADLFIPETRTIVDVKTTTDGSFNAFQRSIANFRYHVQAAFYLDGFSNFHNVDNFVFIVVEKSAPYAVSVYVLDDASVEKGVQEYKRNLETYRECLKSNEWPGYTKEPQLINLPAYSW